MTKQPDDFFTLAAAKPSYSDPVIVNCRRCGMPRPIDEPCRGCQREQQQSAELNRREP